MTIPAQWAKAVRHALRQTFGVDAPDEVSVMTGGLSGASVLRIGVAGVSYVVRLDPVVDGFGDPRHWHRCMTIAAEADVAPKVHYAGENGVSIVDFVVQDPVNPYWVHDRTAMLKDLGGLLARLHAAPAFPALAGYLDGMDSLIGNVVAAKFLSEAELAPALARFGALSQAYRALEPQEVASHNDVNPRNLVHDGERLWLVDWVAAFQGDRYTDLASIGSFMAREEADEAVFLAAYFAAPATPAQRARLYLARLINHMFYAMIMLTTTGGLVPVRVRSLAELQMALGLGEPVMDTVLGRAEYARARLTAMADGVASPRFTEACALAA